MSEVCFREIHDLSDPLLPAWKALYEEAFPLSERMGWKVHFEKCIPATPPSHWVVAVTLEDDENHLVALASYGIDSTDAGDVLFLWYLATDANLRGQGIGQQVMTEIKRRAAENACIGVVLEVAIPELAPNKEEARLDFRRIGFYKRQGARLVREIYYQQGVTVDEEDEQPEPLPMHLMIIPVCEMSLDEYRVIAEAMDAEVVGEFDLE
jgi:ribosomal protein S18 acetylase RimI-like enzyme